MKISGWGLFPQIESKKLLLKPKLSWKGNFIAKGNLRSYGDSALAENHIDMLDFNAFISFDQTKGTLIAQSGVLISDIIDIIVPKGWFLNVVPGTKYITLGGAIAADIHGKNHHKDGCFSNFVESFTLVLPDNQEVLCSTQENTELFHATCGGMGLTGIIKNVTIQLKKINSININQITHKTENLLETFKIFEQESEKTYSVAWIDCLQKGKNIGRSLIMTGEFCNDEQMDVLSRKKINIPFNFPSFIINSWTLKVFNYLYYNKVRSKKTSQKVYFDTFFFPLDSINNWNKIYGKNGFFQFQFILPKSKSYEGMLHILNSISRENTGSFLAVLKLYGKSNNNLLSFPMEGYSLALDFKRSKKNRILVEALTDYVIVQGGRVYLAKDSLLTRNQFDRSYSNTELFRSIRSKYNFNKNLNSMQSIRLGL